MSSIVSDALMSLPAIRCSRGMADSAARASRSCGYPLSPSRLQKRSTVVSDVFASWASSVIVRSEARRASASTWAATRSSAGRERRADAAQADEEGCVSHVVGLGR